MAFPYVIVRSVSSSLDSPKSAIFGTGALDASEQSMSTLGLQVAMNHSFVMNMLYSPNEANGD